MNLGMKRGAGPKNNNSTKIVNVITAATLGSTAITPTHMPHMGT
jgi:hypothetical protein